LRKLAGPTIEFLGQLSNQAITELYSQCKAFVFPGIEDFGITPLEAMASGAPVIAYAEGGALETVTEQTGVFFRPQTKESLISAILKIEQAEVSFVEEACRARAAGFSRKRFQNEFMNAIREAWVSAGKNLELLSGSF
jgi:glycosyltransferase involved in cell wall biosynthesis